MTTKLGTLTVDLLAKTGAFETDIKRAARTTDREMDRIGKAATRAGVVIGVALASAATATAIAVKNAIDSADELGKLSQKIGISVEALSGLKVAADLSGVSLDQLQGGIVRLARAQDDAAKGQGKFADLFASLGVSTTDASGRLRATNDVLLDLSEVFKSLPDGAEKTALAVELFGRSGADLIPLLNLGIEGVSGLTQEALDLNQVLDSKTSKAAEEFNDNLTKIRLGATGLANELARGLLPTLLDITDALTDLAKAANQTFRSEGLFADDFFGKDSGIIAQFYRNRGFESPGLINTGDGPTLLEVLGGARGDLKPVEFITPDNLANAAKPPPAPRSQDDVLEALKKFRELEEERKKAEKARQEEERNRRDAARRAASELAKAAAEQKRAEEERDRAAQEFTRTLQDLEAQIGGPLAQAELEWMRRQEQIEDLARRGEISEEQRQKALDATAELRRRDIEAITSQKTAAESLLDDLEFELGLLKLSNVDREIAIALRYANVDAISAEGLAIAESIRKLDEARKQVQAADDVRDAFAGTFASIIDGTKSVKDAFEDLGSYITQLVARRLGDQLVESLFGARGTPLGGSTGGGLFSNILGSLFGGGRAAGGWVAPGKLYEVAENGPELLRVGNRQFLLPTATGGMVTPPARMGGGVQQNITITVAGQVDMRTREQIAADVSRASQRAVARSY